MAAEVVGTAFVRIRALTTSLAKDIERGVDKGAKDADVSSAGGIVGDNFAKAAGEKIKAGLGEAVADGTKNIDRKVDVDGGRRAGDRVGEGLKAGISESLSKGFSSIGQRITKQLGLDKKGGSSAGKDFGGGFAGGMRGALLKVAVIFAPAILGAGSALLQYAVALTAQVGLLAQAAIGGGIALGGAFGAGLLAIGPLLLAFKTQTPALKRFKDRATEVGKAFKEVGAATQEQLLPGLSKALDLSKKLIPIFRGYGREVGRIVGSHAEYLAALITSAEGQERVRDITQLSVPVLETMARIGIRLGDILSRLFVAVLPISLQFVEALERMVTRWQEVLAFRGDTLTATIQVWYDRAVLVGGALADLLVGLWNILNAGAGEAVPFFENFATWAAEFRAFTSTEVGQARLGQIFRDALEVAHEFNGLLVDIGRRIGAGVFEPGGNEGIITFIRVLREDVVPFLDVTFRGILRELGPSLTAFADSFGEFLTALSDAGGLKIAVELLASVFDILTIILGIPGMPKFIGLLLGFAGAFKVLSAVGVVGLVKGLGAVIGTLASSLTAAGGGMTIFGTATSIALGPLLLAVGIVAAVVAAVVLLVIHWDKVKDAFAATVRFLKDPMKRLERLGELLGDLGSFLKEKFVKGLDIAKTALGDFAASIREKLEDALGKAVEFIKKIPGEVQGALSSLGGTIVDALAGVGTSLLEAFGSAVSTVAEKLPGMLATLVVFFLKLPFLIPIALIGLAFNIIEFLLQTIVDIGAWLLLTGFPTVVGFFLQLPGLIIDGLVSLSSLLLEIFTGAITTVVDFLFTNIPKIWQFFIDLPGNITEFLKEVVPIIGGTFRDAMADALTFVTNGFRDIVSGITGFIGSIPGYATDIYEAMKEFGGDIWQGVKDGFGAAGEFIGNVISDVKNAVIRGIKGFINDIVARLEDAIEIHIDIPVGPDIDFELNVPGFPLKLAQGGIFDRATNATVGEAGREVVIPLTRPKRALELFEQSGLAQVLAQARRSGGRGTTATTVAGSSTVINQTFNEKVNPTLLASELSWMLS